MPGSFSIPHLIFLGLILLVIFGPKRLPELGRSLGSGFKELKSSLNGEDSPTVVHEVTAEPAQVVAAPAVSATTQPVTVAPVTVGEPVAVATVSQHEHRA